MRVLRSLFVMMLAAVVVAVPATAQGEVTISLAVSIFNADIFEDRIIPAFEAQNPGIKIHLVKLDTFGSPLSDTTDDIESYLDSAADYLTKADVVAVGSDMQRALTRTGYLLDLSPLADTDAALNAGDFYTPALNALRWDGGLWGLPTNTDVVQVFYDRQAFDNAGLAYPNGNWTAADYANAIRVLTELDSTGNAAELAVQLTGEGQRYLFGTLAGDVLDDSVLPNVPDYSSPALYTVVDEWVRLSNENYLTRGQGSVVAIGPDAEPTALTIGPSTYVMVGEAYSERIGTAPLPGNQSIVTASGYGISGGTRNPEAAYALVKFLSSSADAASLNFNGTPARRSISLADAGTGGGMRIQRLGSLPASVETEVNAARETGRPASELAFTEGISSAINTVLSGTVSIEAALQQAEDSLLGNLTTAEGRRASPLVVDAPPAPIVLAAGEVALNFAVVSNMTSLTNAAQWEQLAAEFTAQDPQVGAVIVNSALPFGRTGETDLNADYDCYVTTNNPLTGSGTDGLFSVDPLLQSDMAFNPNDLYAGVLSQLQSGGLTWGIPVALTVESLSYDPALFAAAGVPLPAGGWTVADFELALRLLRDYTGTTPFIASPFSTTYLSTLIAAYGGIPYDTSTAPATLRYDDPASIAAIQQVLDLALAGYITYEPFSGGRSDFNFSTIEESPLTTSSVGMGSTGGGGMGFTISVGRSGETPESTRANAPYPTGITLNGVSYGLTAGFISASTANIEPCYRWLSYVSQHPELFSSMPVSRSLVADPSLDVAVGASLAAFYRGYGALLDNPTTRVISDIPLTFGTPAASYWLLKAMDDYIAAGGDFDLAAALTDAQAKASEYLTCTANVNQFDGRSATSPEEFRAMAQQMVSCAVSVDPSTASIFQ